MARAATRDGSPEVVSGFFEWIRGRGEPNQPSNETLQRYFHGIAEARYVIRKVFRLVDEQAKAVGLDPLEHQALIQIFGSPVPLRVIDLADRLDIAPAFASRLTRKLGAAELVKRTPSRDDKRSTCLSTTPKARKLLTQIDEAVQLHVEYFQRQLRDDERVAALAIFAFYLGAEPDVKDLARLLAKRST